MKIKVSSPNGKIFCMNIDCDTKILDFLAFCEIESEIPKSEFIATFEKRPLDDESKTLKFYGITEGSHIIMQRKRHNNSINIPSDMDFSGIQISSASGSGGSSNNSQNQVNIDSIRETFLNDPQKMATLRVNNPMLADAVVSGDYETMTRMIHQTVNKRTNEQNNYMKLLTSDPFDAKAQRLIEEEIQRKNIQANMEHAIEFAPETFGLVTMLYINCKVNGYPFKAFVDSGAQQTIISYAATQKCNIGRLIDRRWHGVARGVGTQKIIGRIHMVQMEIENVFFATSFSVLEDQPMDILLGLDLLKRYQCSIDLQHNNLVIGTTGTTTRFLTEAELPKTNEDPHEFSETDVEDIMTMGFTRSDVIIALKQNRGDKDLAVIHLVSNKK